METAPPPLARARVAERDLRLWPPEEGSTEWNEAERGKSWEEESGGGVPVALAPRHSLPGVVTESRIPIALFALNAYVLRWAAAKAMETVFAPVHAAAQAVASVAVHLGSRSDGASQPRVS